MFSFDFDSNAKPVQVRKEVKTPAGAFTLIMDPPPFEEKLFDESFGHQCYKTRSMEYASAFKERFERRLAYVVGWEGVVDKKKKPVPFSQQALRAVIAKSPTIFDHVQILLGDLFYAEDRAAGESDESSVEEAPTKEQ